MNRAQLVGCREVAEAMRELSTKIVRLSDGRYEVQQLDENKLVIGRTRCSTYASACEMACVVAR